MAGIKVNANFLDRAISWLNPKAGATRLKYRAASELLKTEVRRYDAASNGRRTSGWFAPGSSAQTEVHQALSFLRNRSRELVRNNPYAENAINEIATNITGTGILPKAIGLPVTIEKRLKQVWNDWADTTECDYDGHLNLYGIQQLAARTIAESGEVLVRFHVMPNAGMEIPLQLQILEPDYIDSTRYSQPGVDGTYIRYGVEFNKDHKIIAYWLWDNHPGDSLQFATKSSRVDAKEIVHTFLKKRPGQFRGVPFGHASMLRLKDLEDYEDAQLIRQKIAACFTVFVTDTENSATIGGVAAKTDDDLLEKVEPGIVEYLPAGKQVTMASPPDAGANYDPYVKSVLRGVSSGYGMDYVTLTGDLTAVNFSSGRMGWLKFNRNVSSWQWLMMVPQFCNPIWDKFIQVANVMGYIRQPKVKVRWTPPRRQMIDPVKEIEGQKESIRAGLSSWQDTIRANGEDPEEVLQEMIDAAKQFDDAGLMPTSDPRYDAARKQPDAVTNSTDGAAVK